MTDKKKGVGIQDVYTINEAADFLGCHRETIRRAVSSGDLKAALFGRVYRISKEDLNAYYQAKGGGKLF